MNTLVLKWNSPLVSQAALDALFWVTAVLLAGVLRFEFDFSQIDFLHFLTVGIAVAILNFVVGTATGLYRGFHRGGSLGDGTVLAVQATVLLVISGTPTILLGSAIGIPRSTILIATPIFFALSAASRVFRRATQNKGSFANKGKKTLVYGAGEMAEILIPQLLADPGNAYQVVGLIDDDPTKARRRIGSVRCLGDGMSLGAVASREGAQALIVAVPRADSTLLSRIQVQAKKANLEVIILPTFSEILDKKKNGVGLQSLGIEDLVGRRAIEIDLDFVRGQLAGKKVLVTGAGGSIGIELCRQLAQFEPKQLIYLDRDESGLQMAKLVAEHDGLLDSSNVVLADIRERSVLESVFAQKRPDVVFHAAALKHLPVLERYPMEAWKTNVLGTANLLEVARRWEVETFVNISTDKAADPSSVLGISKLYAEELTAWFAKETGRNYVSVRFGNVLGSRGSLVPTLAELIRQGEPIVLTDPEATRYFMTVSEACQLVLQAVALAQRGDVFVLEMGDPVKILDIARKMIEIEGKPIDIVFRGLREGEKLHERLFSVDAQLFETSHPSIWRTSPNTRAPNSLDPQSFLSIVTTPADNHGD